CDTTGQKAALIGSKGARLKNIGTAARRGLEKLLGKSVLLNQMVKVKKGWSDDSRSVTRLGYSD
ncbi:MAG: KH domain-containing protein, partial [Proteobacteria bacterium]|nr:KH domain-containing protein [Pseudomonadota bacterium]